MTREEFYEELRLGISERFWKILSEEERDIRKVANIFGIKKTLLDRILLYAGSVADIRNILNRKDN